VVSDFLSSAVHSEHYTQLAQKYYDGAIWASGSHSKACHCLSGFSNTAQQCEMKTAWLLQAARAWHIPSHKHVC